MLDKILRHELIEEKLSDLMTPGVTVEVTPIEADEMVAFREVSASKTTIIAS